jgi:hypothetical protein
MSRTGCSRRDLLACLLAAPLAAGAWARAAATPDSFRLLVHGKLSRDAMRGLHFGVSESAVTAGLMQRELQLGTSAPGITGAIGVVAAEPPGPDSVPPATPIMLLRDAGAHGSCLFRIGLTAADRQANLDRWRAATPQPAPDATVVEWHPGLTRYGAKDVNDRYRKQTGGSMTAEAWTAWFAVKALVDSALRAQDGDLCRALSRARFDGHKGRSLSFDPQTRVLRQPLYVVSAGTVIAELESGGEL